jgi:Flp pilus assembly pilin Flp
MIKIQKARWSKLLAVGLCALMLTLTPPRKAAAQGLTEYALILALIAIIAIAALQLKENPEPVVLIVNQLKTAVEAAQLANSQGNRPAEISRLSKAIGLANSLMVLTSSCDSNCGVLRAYLQQIIGLLAHLSSLLLGVSATCNPDGFIGPNEQCDPLANPTGCQSLTLQTFCNDECRCVAIP